MILLTFEKRREEMTKQNLIAHKNSNLNLSPDLLSRTIFSSYTL
jgi:hypothetical protein